MVLSFDHGGIDEGNVRDEIMRLSNEVLGDPDNFDAWDKLIAYAEQLEGGPTRNSSPQAIAAYREAFDRLLEKFPLMFGYWKKYADREFLVAGPESAQMIYERGVASIPNSVDLWAAYCQFMMEVHHNAEQVQELFERGVENVGLDFHAHPFWDLYLEFQARNTYTPNAQLHGEFQILTRIVQIPLYHYARYSQKFNEAAANQPTSAMCPTEVYAQIRAEIMMDSAQEGKSEDDIDREIRNRLNSNHQEAFQNLQTQVSDRWTYEKEIKRGYFHVTELDAAELENWEKYLQFEVERGEYKRITVLFERCLVPTAYYDKFWFMYAHFMLGQTNKTEELRNIYMRASCLFCAITRPAIRLEWALFEEMMDRPAVANDLYNAVLDLLPGDPDTVKALCNATRRHQGPSEAIEAWKKQLTLLSDSATTRSAMITDLARFSARAKEPTDPERGIEGRQMFLAYQGSLADSPQFWAGYLTFEIEHPPYPAKHDTVKALFGQIRKNQALKPEAIADLGELYKSYLLERGPSGVAKEVITLIHELDG